MHDQDFILQGNLIFYGRTVKFLRFLLKKECETKTDSTQRRSVRVKRKKINFVNFFLQAKPSEFIY